MGLEDNPLGKDEVQKKADAVMRTTDHVLSVDYDTLGYVAFNLTPPMNPCLLETAFVRRVSLSAIQNCIETHVRKELGKLSQW